MISTFTAFIDANVFYGAKLRSLVLFCAQTKIFRARWSDEIHEEWINNLIRNRPDLTKAQLSVIREQMNRAVPDCLVKNYEALIPGLQLPDPEDRHVLAAAIFCKASVIVTFNVKHFPSEWLQIYGIEAIHPDDFLLDTFEMQPSTFLDAVTEDYKHYVKPQLTFNTYVEQLAKAGIPDTANKIKEFEVLIT